MILPLQTAALSDIPTRKPHTIQEKDLLPEAAPPVKQHCLVRRKKGQENKVR